MSIIQTRIRESIEVKQKILDDPALLFQIEQAVSVIQQALKAGGKILFCGNGGSAADAQHLTAELVGKFQRERKAMAALCLNTNVSSMTAIANDYSYDIVFARAVEGLMRPEDVLVGISTSGNSENVYQAMKKAKELGGRTVSLLGGDGGKIREISDVALIAPSGCTARVQEAHITVGHILCELVENAVQSAK